MALPDFMIIGAMKSGTSTLQVQLAAQDGVFMTTPKEPNFFSDDPIYAKGRAWYESLYDDAAPGDLRGEASTHYTKLPTYPKTVERIAEMIPNPRLIYVIRDPLQRAISHYIHEWTMGVMDGDAVAAFESHPELTEYSRYSVQIAPFVERFGPDAILLLRTEDLKTAPDATLARVGTFLGRDDFAWAHDLGAQNVSAERSRRLPFHDVIVDNPVATALRRTLVPKGLRTWIRESRAPKERPTLPDHLTERLQAVFDEDRAELAKIFPEAAS